MTQDYKSTLNLPETDFPMKAGLAQTEPARLKQWEGLYEKIEKQAKNQPHFILHDGPPYANGKIHMGHALNKVLKDMVMKAKRLSGFRVPYVPGWDCHGLPIELMVEKKIGKAGQKISYEAFRQHCREYAATQIQQQSEDFQRLGILGDWKNRYATMDYRYEADIIRAFAKILKNGHVYQGSKPVHWCIDCGSALAEAEVEYAQHASSAIHVRFKVVDVKDFEKRLIDLKENLNLPINIPIWTTTPWTLPANQAVALNPRLTYSVVRANDEILVIAKSLLEDVMALYGVENYQVLTECEGQVLENLQLQHPFLNRQVPVVLGDHVTIDAGTGAVHTAPAHGADDFAVGQQYDLPSDSPVDNRGCFNTTIPEIANMMVFKANPVIVDWLKTKGALLAFKEIQHSYPHCWRHKSPIIFRTTPQWFINVSGELREQAIDAIESVDWMPEWGESRIKGMVSDRPDWCISRQRIWGVPIPLFIHQETRALHPDTLAILEKVAQKVEKSGVEAWYEMKASDLMETDADKYEKSLNILDVWFDSGVSHDCVLRQRQDLDVPADLYLEGSDQHRGWFQSSLLSSVAQNGDAPFKAVLTHGYVVDAQGRKMSKSLGNIVAPQEIIQQYGADILRLWVAMTDYRAEVHVSDEILKRTADMYRRLRNTARFLLANLNGFDLNKDQIPPDQMLALDRWIVETGQQLQTEIRDSYESYQFHVVCQKIHNFCAVELGGFYLDIIKDRQYTTQTNSVPRRSAQTAMYYLLQGLVRWLAPILSFTADEIWQYMPKQSSESVFLESWFAAWPETSKDKRFDAAFWEQMMAVKTAVNKVIETKRDEIRSSLKAEVKLFCSPELEEKLKYLENELRFVLITSTAEVYPQTHKPSDAIKTEVEGLWLEVSPSESLKCVRCWHHRQDIGRHSDHPELCGRCVENVSSSHGETRRFA